MMLVESHPSGITLLVFLCLAGVTRHHVLPVRSQVDRWASWSLDFPHLQNGEKSEVE